MSHHYEEACEVRPRTRPLNSLEPPPKVTKGELSINLDRLAMLVSGLEEQVSRLSAKLEPVMRSASPSEPCDKAVMPSPTTELGKALFDSTERIDIQIERLISIRNRVEV